MCAYAGNILGCALMVAIFANTGLLPQLTRGAEALAIYKTAAPFKEVRPVAGPLCPAGSGRWQPPHWPVLAGCVP